MEQAFIVTSLIVGACLCTAFGASVGAIIGYALGWNRVFIFKLREGKVDG